MERSIAETKAVRPSDRLLEVLAEYDQCLVVVHDNPDPDAIAAGWAILVLIEDQLHKPVRLVAGGAILRAENQHMVELLHPPIELVERLPWNPRSAAILVDCGAGTSNHLLTRAGIAPIAVIDHHLNESRFGGEGVRFRDVRVRVSASASIAASYLREQHIEPGEKLATAMLYAFRAETSGSAFRFTKLDRWAHLWLTRRANPALLAEIENAPLTRSYYGDLILALQNTFVYDDVALCFLPRAHGAEIVGEVADLLIRERSIRRVLCGAAVGADLLMSARTEGDQDSATDLLTRTIHGLGTAGGHQNRAGGKIPAVARAGRIAESLEDDLRNRWLEACQVERQRGTRLIARRLIVGNL